FAFAPDGTIWYAERFTGQIRYYNPSTKADKLWTTINGLSTDGEQGLLGLALDPQWPTSKWVYAYYTQTGPVNRMVRIFRKADGSFLIKNIKWIPANSYHNGGKVHFGPDGNLYAVTGETGNPALAQNKGSMAGKVLRFTKTGGVPVTNPFHNPVYSFGHRNSFGFTWDPTTKFLWQTENGPECNDGINLIVRGGNFAWGPNEYCPVHTNNSGPFPRQYPKGIYNPTIAPTGAAFCTSCGLGAGIEGNLLFGTWNDQAISALKLTAARNATAASTVIYTHASGTLELQPEPRGVDS